MFDEHTREVDYSDKSVTGKDKYVSYLAQRLLEEQNTDY